MTITHDHTEISVGDFRANVSDAINRTVYGGERVLVTRRGKATAALISAEELDYFEKLEDLVDNGLIERALASADESEYTPAADVRAELGL